jgi:sortase A
MLAWCGLVLADANISQRIARQSLETVSQVAAPALPRPPASTNAPKRAPIVRTGSAIAELSIPRVDLSAVVLHGSDVQTLRRGPGHVENTALPGEAGNVVIAGHRDSHFRPLRDVRLGDDVFVDTPEARYRYRVTSLRVVNPHDLSVLEPSDDDVLTLITCYPFWILGNASDRFIVRAARVTESAAADLAVRAPQPETIDAPEIQRATPITSITSHGRLVTEDETLVRQVIERFRVTYNARLLSHHDVRPSGPLKFQSCTVAVALDQATAACEVASSALPSDGEAHVWEITLERTDTGWAMRSLVAN